MLFIASAAIGQIGLFLVQVIICIHNKCDVISSIFSLKGLHVVLRSVVVS